MAAEALAVLAASALAAAAFRAAYWGLERRTAEGPEEVSRYVSSLHSVLVVALCLGAPGFGSGGWRLAAQALPLGYLAHDLQLLASRPALRDPWMVLHHVSFALLVACGVGAYPAEAQVALRGEAPVPFLNLGWALHRRRKAGAPAGPAWLLPAVGGATLGLFVATRLLVFPSLAATTARDGQAVATLALVSLSALNFFWFQKLLRLACGAR